MNPTRRNSLIWILLLITSACVEPYDPPIDNTNVNFLVVEGFLDASRGSAQVRMTRSLPVGSTEVVPAEPAALVSVPVALPAPKREQRIALAVEL